MISKQQFELLAKQHQDWISSKNKSGARADFSNAILENIDSNGLVLLRSNFRDSKISNSYWMFSIFSYANFRNSTINGLQASGSNFCKCIFNGSNLKNVSFRNTNQYGASYENCVIDSVDFRGSNLRDANFNNCKITNSNLQETDVTGATFNNCSIEGVEISEKSLNFIYSDGKHLGCYKNGDITIGCMSNSTDWWLDNHRKLGVKNEHPEENINRHESILKFLKDNFK